MEYRRNSHPSLVHMDLRSYYPIESPFQEVRAETIAAIRECPVKWAWLARALTDRVLVDLDTTPADYSVVETNPSVALSPDEFHRRYREHTTSFH